jgi:hypothetical protein
LAQNIPSLDGICNLIGRNNTGTEGNDYNTDDASLLQQVLQQS